MPEFPRSVRIMGIPWTVELVDIVYDDPDTQAETDQGNCVIAIRTDVFPVRRRRLLFWAVLDRIYPEVLFGDIRPNNDEEMVVSTALWTALRDNWAQIVRWFDGESPEVPESTLHIQGRDWTLTRPRLIPDKPKNVRGQCNTLTDSLYVQASLESHYAAAVALHELMHAALNDLCRFDGEEGFVTPVAACLAVFFFDNPDVANFIFGEADAHEKACEDACEGPDAP